MIRNCAGHSRLLLLCFLASVPAAAADQPGHPGLLKLATFNIHHAEGTDSVLDLKRVADVVRGSDIVAFQEVDVRFDERSRFADQAALLGEELKGRAVFGCSLIRNEGRYGVALVSRFPVLSERNHPLPRSPEHPKAEPRGLLEVVLDVHGQPLRVYVTHLDPVMKACRLLQVDRIKAIVAEGSGPFILMGDLNFRPGSEEASRLFGREGVRTPFVDAWSRVGQGEGNTIQLKGRNPGRIDFVAVSDDLAPGLVSARVDVETIASDHQPVFAELRFPATPAQERRAGTEPAGEPSVYKTVEGRKLRLWVVKPEGWKATDRRPAAVLFHGGGWTGGRPVQFNTLARYLATRGMVCAQVEYRLVGKGDPEKDATPPTVCCQDAKSAVRWVRSHAGEFGIDPARIAAGGGSAGGHLAAFAGMVEGLDDPADDASVSPRPNALILFNPVFDNGPGGWGHVRVKDRYKEFSPAHNVSKDDPPAVVFFGSEDKLVPLKTLEDFQTSMRKAGVRCEAFLYADQGHGFFNRDPWTTKTLIETDRFLESLGWLSGPPTVKDPDK